MDISPTIVGFERDLERNPEYLRSIRDDTNETVTSLYASGHPNIKCPKDAAKVLFEKPTHHCQSKVKHEFLEHEVTQEEMDAAAKYGRFPQRPSDLFLKLFYDVICTLEHDPWAGGVSPRLVGASGVIPLTIISTIPDIMHHYYHVIVHAQKEVLFATCWWEKGETANIIGEALRDLSKRAAREKRHVIVKLMIDHLTKANLAHSHAILPPSKWAHSNIPTSDELPFISMEVNCYHLIILGAFHSKFLVVDRKIALLNSNNIYDRPNLEMMVHYEGDIVNSFYDTFLISWSIPFQPDLVCVREETPAYRDFHFGTDITTITSINGSFQQVVAQAPLRLQHDLSINETETDRDEPLSFSSDEENPLPLLEQRNTSRDAFPNIELKGLVESRNAHSLDVLIKAATEIAGNVIGYDASHRLQHPLTTHLNKSSTSALATKTSQNLSLAELEKLSADFTPFIFHTSHQPIPIALVNRVPHGAPDRMGTVNPQDAAWLGAFRYAQKSIFIQSPTFNASPAIDGIIIACRRGIQVTLWLDLGYNYLKEGWGTFQGGTNEHVVKKIYKQLRNGGDGTEKNLKTFWYTGKDQTRPLHFSQKKRNCHIKFMSIDDQVAIMGSGNMDTQSWFHSQETNAMIDSPLIIKDWIDALYKNQSTNEYGRLDDDGKWRGADGNLNRHDGK